MNSKTVTPSIFDTQALSSLKSGLRKDDPQALKATAQQFEAMFLQMVMKSMRAATPQSSLFDSDQTRFYQELLDSQLAQVMASKGGTGLAAVIERQLSRTQGEAAEFPDGLPLAPLPRAIPVVPASSGIPLGKTTPDAIAPLNNAVPPAPTFSPGPVTDSVTAQFVAAQWPAAQLASQQTGIPPAFLIAHAALESGWGKHEPRFADGRPSYNLFGIKAGSQWSGPVVETTTTEVINGVAEKRVERFRAYGSYAEAFQDHARLLAGSSRYAAVLGSQDAAGFARGLQAAGYATDPAYARKLEKVIQSPALRLASAG